MTIDDHIGRRRRIYLYSQISYRGTRVPPLLLINETSTQKARNSPLLRHLLQTFPVSLSRRLQAAAPAQYRRSGLTCTFFFFHLRDSCRVKAAQVIIFIHTYNRVSLTPAESIQSGEQYVCSNLEPARLIKDREVPLG